MGNRDLDLLTTVQAGSVKPHHRIGQGQVHARGAAVARVPLVPTCRPW